MFYKLLFTNFQSILNFIVISFFVRKKKKAVSNNQMRFVLMGFQLIGFVVRWTKERKYVRNIYIWLLIGFQFQFKSLINRLKNSSHRQHLPRCTFSVFQLWKKELNERAAKKIRTKKLYTKNCLYKLKRKYGRISINCIIVCRRRNKN